MSNIQDKIKVICADDSKLFVEAIKAIFSANDKYDLIEIHNNGAELLESSNIHIADVILLDINMPELNGIETAKRINFSFTNIPLIAITMHKDDMYLQEIIGAGFKAFIYKPDVETALFDVIEKVLDDEFVFQKNMKT